MQWLRDLAVVAVNPRDRIREILDTGETGRVTSNEVFRPGPDQVARPMLAPRCLPELVTCGFDPAMLQLGDGLTEAHRSQR